MSTPEWTTQAEADVRFEWGPTGLAAVAAPYVVVVDVLRFTTAVDAAVDRGARVFPYRWKDASAAAFAESVGARLADGQDPAGPSLSPVRLTSLQVGDAIVLPSPNGSTCASVAAESGAVVLAACLRNASAVASWLNQRASSVAVIACGERWADGSLRPSLEDHLGAGAVIAALEGVRSPEAQGAAELWTHFAPEVDQLVRGAASGRELLARGWADDSCLRARGRPQHRRSGPHRRRLHQLGLTCPRRQSGDPETARDAPIARTSAVRTAAFASARSVRRTEPRTVVIWSCSGRVYEQLEMTTSIL